MQEHNSKIWSQQPTLAVAILWLHSSTDRILHISTLDELCSGWALEELGFSNCSLGHTVDCSPPLQVTLGPANSATIKNARTSSTAMANWWVTVVRKKTHVHIKLMRCTNMSQQLSVSLAAAFTARYSGWIAATFVVGQILVYCTAPASFFVSHLLTSWSKK